LIGSFSMNCRSTLRLANRAMRGLSAIAPSAKFRQRLAQVGMVFAWKIFRYGLALPDSFGPFWDPREIVRRARRKFQFALPLTGSGMSPSDPYKLALLRAIANYIPPKLDSAVVAITAEKEASDPIIHSLLWKSRASVVRQETVPGDHMSCVTVEVEALAKCVSSILKDSFRDRSFHHSRVSPLNRLVKLP
jgi:hypothetical protein